MLVNTKPVFGGHKGLPMILVGASNVVCAKSFALRGALNRMLKDILKLIYSTAKGAVSAPGNAGLKPLPW